MTINPIQKAIDERNLTVKSLSFICGVQSSWIRHFISGYPSRLSGKVLEGLVKLGYDADTLCKEYALWRQEQAEAALAEIAK